MHLPESPITDTYLIDLSCQLWGSEAYGRTAVNMLEDRKQGLRFIASNQGIIEPNGRILPQDHSHEYSPEELEAMGRTWWSEDIRCLPFEPEVTPHKDGRSFHLTVGAATPKRLAEGLRRLRLDNHHLHGSLGKTLDLMKVAGGLAEDVAQSSAPYEGIFLSREEFEELINSAGFTYATHSTLYSKIRNEAVLRQWWAPGRPGGKREVVFEGEVRINTRLQPQELAYERIALDSLPGLYGKGTSRATPFLNDAIAKYSNS